MKPDSHLLRDFVGTRSEAAFEGLVQRHLGLVYSAVLRQVGGDAHLAKDAAQLVFCDLARKAPSLVDRAELGGWLYRAAHFAAAKLVRRERRRREFEQEAFLMQATDETNGEPDWDSLRGLLDAAMMELNDRDREAVILRFFSRHSFAEVGLRLGLPEDSARKRVERALDKLHGLLTRRGISSTAVGLGLVLSRQGVAAAPEALAGWVTRSALANSTLGWADAFWRSFPPFAPTKEAVLAGFVAVTVGTGIIFTYSQSRLSAAAQQEVTESAREIPVVHETVVEEKIAVVTPAIALAAAEPAPKTVVRAREVVPEPSPAPQPTPAPAVLVARADPGAHPSPGPIPAAEVVPAPPSAADSAASATAEAPAGPHLLYLLQGKTWRLVSDAEREEPFLTINGKREAADAALRSYVDSNVSSKVGNGFALKSAGLFGPALVQVDNLSSRFTTLQTERINRLRKGFVFRASFDPSSPLKRAFLALEVISKQGNHRYYLHELGDLEPGHPKFIAAEHLFSQTYEPGSSRFYIFAGGGIEVMHSEMSAAELAQGVNQLVAGYLKNDPQPRPRPLIAPPAHYPPILKEKKISGRVVVAFRVSPRGQVENAKLTEESDPAFNAAALDTISRWSFIPAVKDGQPIASSVSLPFTFSP